jgi:DNA-directed RNA polymerase specialized sigma24 family protein
MSEPTNDLDALLSRVRAGEEAAVREIVETHGPFLRRPIRFHLSQPLRRLFDSTDILQDVWKSFFVQRVHEHEFPTIEDLIRYLAGMSQSVIHELHRRYVDTGKRDLRRSVPIDKLSAIEGTAMFDRRPSAEQAMSDREQCAHALGDIPLDIRRASVMLSEGCSYRDIATRLRVPERALQQVVETARRRVRRQELRRAE